ncbi:MAG: alkaline shock response membrane anchor protein AmaP [Candidatus Omnitrophota bacterium]|jgi:uncharacterized membrane protein YidH (DUF202 family)
MRTLGILFYTAVLVLIGIVLIVLAFTFSLSSFQPQAAQYINNALLYTQENAHARVIISLSGILLILVSISFAQLILGRFQREKTIAFKTASGEVTIALSAVEDLIKRIAVLMPEVKELRPDVKANKRGITVELRVVLRSEANIPGLTERLEEMTKGKMQEVLGLEEKIFVNTHIVKIVPQEEKDKKQQPVVPFSGYGRM